MVAVETGSLSRDALTFRDGHLLLGTWQQIALLEFDTRPRPRGLRDCQSGASLNPEAITGWMPASAGMTRVAPPGPSRRSAVTVIPAQA